MSYKEALADKIPMEKTRYGQTLYYPPCHLCGNGVMSYSYIQDIIYTCKECKSRKDDIVDYLSTDLRKEEKTKKLENAILRIAKVTNIEKYREAIKWVNNNLGKANWLQSTEEIMVALELFKRGIKAHHQVNIKQYRADFVLPDDKIVLEIDGTVFHRKDTKPYEKARDNTITMALGLDWEVIRISTNHINKNITKLIPAIRAVKRERKRLREKYKGTLPLWHSDSEI